MGGIAIHTTQDSATEEFFGCARKALASSMILLCGTMFQLGLADSLKAGLLELNVQMILLYALMVSINIGVLFHTGEKYFALIDSLMKNPNQPTDTAKNEPETICFDQKPIALLEGFTGEANGIYRSLYEVKSIEKNLSVDTIRNLNVRLDDLYSLLGEYHLLNSYGRKAVDGKISNVIQTLNEELIQILVQTDQQRISRIERKVERILNG